MGRVGVGRGLLLLRRAAGSVGRDGAVDGFLREDVCDTLVVPVATTASAGEMLVYVI